jgi:hypothetical protein
MECDALASIHGVTLVHCFKVRYPRLQLDSRNYQQAWGLCVLHCEAVKTDDNYVKRVDVTNQGRRSSCALLEWSVYGFIYSIIPSFDPLLW